MNLGELGGWLKGKARTSATGKAKHLQTWAFGRWSHFARACHLLESLQKQVAPRLKNSPFLKRKKN
jgi:hypothetical protein